MKKPAQLLGEKKQTDARNKLLGLGLNTIHASERCDRNFHSMVVLCGCAFGRCHAVPWNVQLKWPSPNMQKMIHRTQLSPCWKNVKNPFVVLLATLEGLSPGKMNRSEIYVDAGLKFHLFLWFSLQSPHNTCACEGSNRKVTLLMNPWAVLIDSLHSESSSEKTQPINPIFLSHRFRSSSTSIRLPARHSDSPFTWLLHPRCVHKRGDLLCQRRL